MFLAELGMCTDTIAESIARPKDLKIIKKICGIGMYIQTVIILKIKYVYVLIFWSVCFFLY